MQNASRSGHEGLMTPNGTGNRGGSPLRKGGHGASPRRSLGWVVRLLMPAVGALAVAGLAGTGGSDLVVHEWGTFLAMQGADGVTLDGMYHEEHALPAFVHARSRDQLQVRRALMKGETPVIYFYTAQPQNLQVQVRFPQGIWTQWYPQAAVVSPGLTGGATPPLLERGLLHWHVRLLPARPGVKPPTVPATSGDALWNHSRQVDAAFVQVRENGFTSRWGETERFLFYRGLGGAALPVAWKGGREETLSCTSDCPEGVRDLFAIRVEGGRGAFRYFPALRRGLPLRDLTPAPQALEPLPQFKARVGRELEQRLTAAGLYPKEARAMVNTWRSSYFETEGTRILFLLPQAWTDRFIPLRVKPVPQKVVRVMVGRLEALTPEREDEMQKALRQLSAGDTATRQQAFAHLREQGRYLEPIVREVARTTTDATVRDRCRLLLATPLLDELRAATRTAAGRPLTESPLYVRAQLAALLREVGLAEEARAEGTAILPVIERQLPSRAAREADRHPLRAHARALEGVGDDATATRAYERYIRFGALALTRPGECVGCHTLFADNGPSSAAWFTHWWAGRRYALAASRSGQREALLATHTETLRQRPTDPAPRLLAEYLRSLRE